MGVLNIAELKHETVRRVKFFTDFENLQEAASKLFPGCRLILTDGQATDSLVQSDGSNPSAFAQIQAIMKNIGMGADLDVLLNHLGANGIAMNRPSLMTNLSRGKDRGIFKNFGRGLWGLPEHPEGKYLRFFPNSEDAVDSEQKGPDA